MRKAILVIGIYGHICGFNYFTDMREHGVTRHCVIGKSTGEGESGRGGRDRLESEVLRSIQGSPVRDRARQSCKGSASHWFMLCKNRFSASFRIVSLSRAKRLQGVSSPNSVMVWKPCARRSGARMLSSVRV